jgi:NDP-sugar pyrophosphorylase family protein
MKPSVLILAAGIGSRYGGIKQLDKFGPSGETIMDYSIFDAKRAGFEKITFIIRKAIEKDFKEVFINRLKKHIDIEYVFQELDHLPPGFSTPKDRKKPWGTAHAVMVSAGKLKEPFLVLNADDFYGAESFKIGYDYLSSLKDNDSKEYCILGYYLSRTLSDHGFVSRGVCETDDNFNLKEIVERLKIFRKDGQTVFEEKKKLVQITGEKYVSMNMMGFTPIFFSQLKEY